MNRQLVLALATSALLLAGCADQIAQGASSVSNSSVSAAASSASVGTAEVASASSGGTVVVAPDVAVVAAPQTPAAPVTAEASNAVAAGASNTNESSSVSSADVRSSGSSAASGGGTGSVVARARSSVNGTAYEVLCTSTGGSAAQTSSISVRQQTASENGVVKARVVLASNGVEYPVVVDGVTNASALASLNASLTNVTCTVSA